MPLRYRIRRMGTGNPPYTTRADLGPALTENEVIEGLVQASAISEGDIRSVLSNLRRILALAAQQTRPSESLFGLFRLGVSCGGGLQDPEQTVTVDDLSPSLNLYPAVELTSLFLTNLTLERTGIDSGRTPDIQVVRNDATGVQNTYTPGDALRITGEDLKLDPADLTQGVFFKNAAGTEVRAARYFTSTGGTLLVLVPATLTGLQTLIVRVKYDDNLRQTTFDETLS